LLGGVGGTGQGVPLGPQGNGAGWLAVADWWLTKVLEVAAAAPPATTTRRAKMRMASFIISNPLRFGFAESAFSAHNNRREKFGISPVISYI
jgi:hypothetical protein